MSAAVRAACRLLAGPVLGARAGSGAGDSTEAGDTAAVRRAPTGLVPAPPGAGRLVLLHGWQAAPLLAARLCPGDDEALSDRGGRPAEALCRRQRRGAAGTTVRPRIPASSR